MDLRTSSMVTAVGLCLSWAAPGCSCSNESGVDGGRADTPADAGASDTSEPTPDGGLDAPPGIDGGIDAPAIVDAGADAPAVDVGADAGLAPLELFATIGDSFVRIDTTTGDATLIGPTGIGRVAKLTYDASADVIYGIIDYLTTPRLVTVDPCTGAASGPITLTLTSGTVYFVGAIDYDPTSDVIFATLSRNGAYPAESVEEHLATLDPTTGVLTSVADLRETGLEVDGDALMLSSTLDLLMDADPAPGAPIHTFWRLDLATGAATGRVTAPESLHAIEPHNGVIYGWSGAGPLVGHLVTVDADTGVVTDIGPTHTSAEFGGAALDVLVEARASCD